MAWTLVVVWLLFVAWMLVGFFVSSGKGTSSYRILKQADGYLLREYPAHLEAHVSITGSRSFAVSEGRHTLNEYLRGDNTLQEAAAPSRPEGIEPGPLWERIGTWAPVLVEQRRESYDIAVALPTSYTMVTVPRPNNPAIRIIQVPAMTVAAHGWRGVINGERAGQEEVKLRSLLGGQKRAILSAVRTAELSPLWVPSFLRFNEVYAAVRLQE